MIAHCGEDHHHWRQAPAPIHQIPKAPNLEKAGASTNNLPCRGKDPFQPEALPVPLR
jgi:hypothetical protein